MENFQDLFHQFQSTVLKLSYPKLTFSLIIFFIFIATKLILVGKIKTGRLNSFVKERWIFQVKVVAYLLFVFLLLIIWAAEIQDLALSLAAFSAAFAIAGKEFLLCALGGIYKAIAQPYQTGDRIQIGDIRGTVHSNNFLTTSILQIGEGDGNYHYTGKIAAIPNGNLFTQPIINETNLQEIVPHVFSIDFDPSDDILAKEALILEIAREKSSEYTKQAEKIRLSDKFFGMSLMPKATIQMKDKATIVLHFRVMAPSHRKGGVVQEILREYLEQTSEKTSA